MDDPSQVTHFLSVIDYCFLAVIVLSVIISLIRGFVREALSLVTWIAAIWLAFNFYQPVDNLLVDSIQTPALRLMVSFSSIFLGVLLVGGIIGFIIASLVKKTGLSGTDRLIGAIFGFARGCLLVAVLTVVAHVTPVTQQSGWQTSLLVPYFESFASWLQHFAPQAMDLINNH